MNEIFLINKDGFDFKLSIGDCSHQSYKSSPLIEGLIGNYIHRYKPNYHFIKGVVPISRINLDELDEKDLPLTIEKRPKLLPHNIDELNTYLSLYKLAFQEAKKYLMLL
jgi:hypothetical protein